MTSSLSTLKTDSFFSHFFTIIHKKYFDKKSHGRDYDNRLPLRTLIDAIYHYLSCHRINQWRNWVKN